MNHNPYNTFLTEQQRFLLKEQENQRALRANPEYVVAKQTELAEKTKKFKNLQKRLNVLEKAKTNRKGLLNERRIPGWLQDTEIFLQKPSTAEWEDDEKEKIVQYLENQTGKKYIQNSGPLKIGTFRKWLPGATKRATIAAKQKSLSNAIPFAVQDAKAFYTKKLANEAPLRAELNQIIQNGKKDNLEGEVRGLQYNIGQLKKNLGIGYVSYGGKQTKTRKSKGRKTKTQRRRR